MYHYMVLVKEQVRKKCKTYLEDIRLNASLGSQRVLVKPTLSKGRVLMQTLLGNREVGNVGNIVLLADSETGAAHGGIDQAAIELRVEVHRVLVGLDGRVEQAKKLASSGEESTTLRNSDVLRLVPGQLLDGANEALVGALGALLGVGRLEYLMLERFTRRSFQNLRGEGPRHA